MRKNHSRDGHLWILQWLENNLHLSREGVLRKVFDLREKKPADLKNELGIDATVQCDGSLRKLRTKSIKFMTALEIKRDPDVKPEMLWQKWSFHKIRGWSMKSKTRKIRGYIDIFNEAKKNLQGISLDKHASDASDSSISKRSDQPTEAGDKACNRVRTKGKKK